MSHQNETHQMSSESESNETHLTVGNENSNQMNWTRRSCWPEGGNEKTEEGKCQKKKNQKKNTSSPRNEKNIPEWDPELEPEIPAVPGTDVGTSLERFYATRREVFREISQQVVEDSDDSAGLESGSNGVGSENSNQTNRMHDLTVDEKELLARGWETFQTLRRQVIARSLWGQVAQDFRDYGANGLLTERGMAMGLHSIVMSSGKGKSFPTGEESGKETCGETESCDSSGETARADR